MNCNENQYLGSGLWCGSIQKKSIAIVFNDDILSNKELVDSIVAEAIKDKGFTKNAKVEFRKHCTLLYKDDKGNDVYRDDFLENKTTCVITEYI